MVGWGTGVGAFFFLKKWVISKEVVGNSSSEFFSTYLVSGFTKLII